MNELGEKCSKKSSSKPHMHSIGYDPRPTEWKHNLSYGIICMPTAHRHNM
jgi:hypothetical protein